MTHYPRSNVRLAVYGVLVCAVLALDVVTPLGINVPILYLAPLLGAFLLDGVRLRIGLTTIVAVLTVAAVPLEWSAAWQFGLVNRAFDLAVFGVALALSIRDAGVTRELKDLKHGVDQASIVVVTDPAGRVRYANQRFCERSGLQPDRLVGGDWRALIATPGPVDDLWPTLDRGEIWHGEVRYPSTSGGGFWTDTTAVPFRRESGQPYQYLFLSNDITDRRRAEVRLRHLAGLSRIGEMAALVAHEVRNPLAGVRAGLQVLDGRGSLAPAEKDVLRGMVERLDVLNEHVAGLVDFARPRVPRFQPHGLRPILDEAIRTALAACARRGVDCRAVGADARVLGDRAMLHEVFTHLLDNACRAAADGGGTVVVTVLQHGDTVDVAVTDDGPGIPRPLQQRVFEPLFTTRSDRAGLGLAVVRLLVDLHGGETTLHSSSDGGTTVCVRLPASDTRHQRLADMPAAALSAAHVFI